MNDYQSILSTTVSRWQALVDTLPPALLHRRPAPDEWSAVECLVHIIDIERYVFPVRVQALLAGQDFSAYDQDKQGTRLGPNDTPARLVEQLALLRKANLELLKKVTPADLSRTARHSELGQVTLSELLNEWAAHDLDHTIQAERAIMQPFIADSGPWEVYFKSNWIDPEKK